MVFISFPSKNIIKFKNFLLVNDEIKWRIIITKTFDFFLPSKILNQCLVLSFDVIDVIANNLIEGNNKISLDTAVIREETLIFNCNIIIFINFMSNKNNIFNRYTRNT
jgi:hypothetical protein